MPENERGTQDTLLIHSGRDPQKHAGLVNMPVFRGSTVLFPDVETYEHRDPDNFKSMRYGIHGTPTTFALEEAIAQLEGGYSAVAVPSGLAAIVAALVPFARPGAHILMVDSVYGPARNFSEKRLRPFGIDVEYYDPLIGGDIEKKIKPNTTAVYCEAPGSLTFEMQDL